MADFSERCREHVPPQPKDVERLIKAALVVLDTNVLLDLYRFGTAARIELLDVFRKLGGRLWIPDQVALEFHYSRATVIAGHGDAYQSVLKAIGDLRASFEKGLATEVRRLANRTALAVTERDELLGRVPNALGDLTHAINKLQETHGISDRFLTDDPVLGELQDLFEGKVGAPLSEDDEKAARDEAIKRVEAEKPPGFKDSDKDDPSGDYLLWVQSLKEAQSRKAAILFVTRDSKSDWFTRINGKTISALPALVREARVDYGVEFSAMSTKTFLVHTRRFMNTSVSESTIRQADSLRSRLSGLDSRFETAVLYALADLRLPPRSRLISHLIVDGHELDAVIQPIDADVNDLTKSLLVEVSRVSSLEHLERIMKRISRLQPGGMLLIASVHGPSLKAKLPSFFRRLTVRYGIRNADIQIMNVVGDDCAVLLQPALERVWNLISAASGDLSAPPELRIDSSSDSNPQVTAPSPQTPQTTSDE